MNRTSLLFFLCLITFFSGCKFDNNDIIAETISTMNSIETIEYKHKIHWKSTEMNINRIDSAICYYDYNSKDTLLGVKYQFVHNEGEQIFNGRQYFRSNLEKKDLVYYNQPSVHEVCLSVLMMNSFYVVKKLLPQIRSDTSIIFYQLNDTLIDDRNCYAYSISMNDKWINPNIGHNIAECKGDKQYNLWIDKSSYLPYQFEAVYPRNVGFWKSTFKEVNTSVSKKDSIWNYERFPNNFLRISNTDLIKSLQNKATAIELIKLKLY